MVAEQSAEGSAGYRYLSPAISPGAGIAPPDTDRIVRKPAAAER